MPPRSRCYRAPTVRDAILRPFVAVILSAVAVSARSPVEPRLVVGWNAVSAQEALEQTRKLASPDFGGRFRGTPDRDEKWTAYDGHRTRMKLAHDLGAVGLVYIYPEVLAHPNGVGHNVAAHITGTDPALAGECVVLGAHFDGVGEHFGLLFPGADDNASGSVVVLQAAKAFATNRERPRRSVVFVLFGGEEQGSAGSFHFAAHVPGDHIGIIQSEIMADIARVAYGYACYLADRP
jgi:hypothetical protein